MKPHSESPLFDPVSTVAAPRFPKTYCSQCGGEFGPGDHGYSHCANHSNAARAIREAPTDIQSFIDDAIIELTKLKQVSIARERHFDCLDPDHLAGLADLGTETARVADMLFYQFATLAGLCFTKTDREGYRFLISDLIDDNLLADIRVRVGDLRAQPAIEKVG